MDTKLVASGPKPDEEREQRPGTDIRASRLYLFSRRPWVGAVRRAFSIVLLVAVDVVGLALGLYVALVLRTRALRRHRLLVAALAGRPRASGSRS